jgi:hypothetical protein
MRGLNPEILNVGLGLAMEFGPSWMQPTQSRLAKRYPRLSPEELDAYEAACRPAMQFGHTEVPRHWHAAAGRERVALGTFRKSVLARYPWVSAKNLKHLWTQGRYYAWKDGELG